ncbi:uncharacterized protein LOC134261969, partial [Saccostrea cucullata]|uniref:uncharacterized protein LOC134261969 n=1 Tax=Saccostrea cuccullata TaxID=36930 RepID=UPI002ED4457A
ILKTWVENFFKIIFSRECFRGFFSLLEEASRSSFKQKGNLIQRRGDGRNVRKKNYNVKSRSKEKLDSLKRPKTGGGPPLPPLTEGEETFLRLSASEPNIHGLEGGIDTDAISPVSTVENISSNIHVPESTQQINAGKSVQE